MKYTLKLTLFFSIFFSEFPAFSQGRHKKPDSFNLSSEMTVIKDQGSRGACASFAALAVMEYELKKVFQRDFNLSEEYLHYLVKSECSIKGDETTVHNCFKKIRSHGVLYENLWPYGGSYFSEGYPCETANYGQEGTPADCYTHIKPPASLAQKSIRGYFTIRVVDIRKLDYITDLLHDQKRPLVFAFPLSHKHWNYTTGAITLDTAMNSEKAPHHFAVICGYDLKRKIYFVRNSWGESFGNKGYGTLAFSELEKLKYVPNGYFVTISAPEKIQLPPEVNVPEPAACKLNTRAVLNEDSTVSVFITGSIENPGHHHIEIYNIFITRQQAGPTETIKYLYTDTGTVINTPELNYMQKIWAHQPDTIFRNELSWSEDKPLRVDFPKKMVFNPNLNMVFYSPYNSLLLRTSFYYTDDIRQRVLMHRTDTRIKGLSR